MMVVHEIQMILLSSRSPTVKRKLPILFIGFALLAVTEPQTAFAQCGEIAGIVDELPQEIFTPNGTTIRYSYRLEDDSYRIVWSRGGESGGPFGPFILTRACAPATLSEENDKFVLLGAGCGTFCWYVQVFPLGPGREPYMVRRPVAFDAERSLIAFYANQDVIRVRSLISGREQDIRTAYECESASGLCFQDAQFENNRLFYTWRYNGEVLSAELDPKIWTE